MTHQRDARRRRSLTASFALPALRSHLAGGDGTAGILHPPAVASGVSVTISCATGALVLLLGAVGDAQMVLVQGVKVG